jgi:diguanylate cyclase (GGDEF)-like protein
MSSLFLHLLTGPPRRVAARTAAWLALALVGLALFGNLAHRPHLAAALHSRNIVVLNTLICAGAVAAATLARTSHRRNLATALYGLVLTIALIVTLERALNLDSVIDAASAHGWAHDRNPHPGRMSLSVCIAMLLLSTGGLLQAWQPARSTSQLTRLLALAAGAIGVLGLFGNMLALDFLYRSLGLGDIAPVAAILLILLSICALFTGPRATRRAPADDFRLNRVTRAVVVLIATVTGLTSFAVMQKRLEQSLAEELNQRLSERASFISTTLYEFKQHAELLSSTVTVAQDLSEAVEHDSPTARAALYQFIHGLMPSGFSAVGYFDLAGKPIARLGTFRHDHARPGTDLVALSEGSYADQIGWDQGYYLYSQRELRFHGQVVGYGRAEQPISLLARLTSLSDAAVSATESSLCSVAAAPVMCFPGNHHELPYQVDAKLDPVEAELVPRGSREPSGMQRLAGLDGAPLLAAFRPVEGTSLVMVLSSDLTDVYAPVRGAFQRVLPLIFLLALAGILVVRWFVRPLVLQLLAMRRAAERSEARFRAAAEGGADALFLLEAVRDPFNDVRDFRFAYANTHGEKLIGLKGAALYATPLSQAVPQFLKSGWFTRYLRVLETGEGVHGNVLVRLPGMQGSWIHQHVAPLGDGLAVTIRDISAQKATEEKLRHAAQTDSLTGLPNRALLLDRIERALLRTTRKPSALALLYLDLDGFKEVNDHYGHAAGDAVLVEFARRLVKGVRAEDTVARLGGDEFCVLVENLEGRAEAFRIAEALLLSARLPFATPGQTLRITTSIGIAFGQAGEQSAAQFLARADSALYQVKRRGRNAYFGEELAEPQSDVEAA